MESRDNMKVLLSSAEIAAKVKELAALITADYREKRPVLVCVLKGAVVFLSDLIRQIEVPLEIDFMAVSSYGADTDSSGVVRIQKDLEQGITGKDILIVEDIVDTGLTLNYLREILGSRGPRSIKVVTLLDKPERRKVPFEPDYCGFIIPDHFVIGYGLDYAGAYRHLADICILDR